MKRDISCDRKPHAESFLKPTCALLFLAVQFYFGISATISDDLCPHGCGVCRKDWAHCPCPEGQVHNFQAGKCVDSCKNNGDCHAQVEVDRLTKEGDGTLGRVKQKMQSAQDAWKKCSQSADPLWQSCKAAYQPEYDKCLENKSKNQCEAQLDENCADSPPPERKCGEQIAEYNRFNYQRMELEQDLRDLRKLHFQCPPAGQCPDVSRTSMLFPDKYGEELCGRNGEGKLNDAMVDNLTDMSTGKAVGRVFMNCTFP